MSLLRVACVQMRSGIDVATNVAAASGLIREAAAGGAAFVATPEMTTLLDRRPGKLLEQARDEEQDLALPAFRALAAELGLTLLLGSIAVRAGARQCANRSFLIDTSGAVKARYDKIHLFDAEPGPGQVYRESSRFVPGTRAPVVDIGPCRLGMTICYDLRFPELYRALARNGADLLVVPSSFTVPTGAAHWHVLLRARAIETGCFVLAPAQHGRHEDGRETYGHTLVVNPWGEVIAEREAGPGVLFADLELDEIVQARRRLPALAHDRPWTVTTAQQPFASAATSGLP